MFLNNFSSVKLGGEVSEGDFGENLCLPGRLFDRDVKPVFGSYHTLSSVDCEIQG
jgi:hypothetical protein